MLSLFRIRISYLILATVLLATVPAFSETYRYDAVGRLISVTYSDNLSVIYTYDANGNRLSRVVGELVLADGDVAPIGARNGDISIADALVILRYALNLITPIPADDLAHGDVAPLGPDGKPNPDGDLTIADALVVLRKALNLVTF